jgi:hypothetical protein
MLVSDLCDTTRITLLLGFNTSCVVLQSLEEILHKVIVAF